MGQGHSREPVKIKTVILIVRLVMMASSVYGLKTALMTKKQERQLGYYLVFFTLQHFNNFSHTRLDIFMYDFYYVIFYF